MVVMVVTCPLVSQSVSQSVRRSNRVKCRPENERRLKFNFPAKDKGLDLESNPVAAGTACCPKRRKRQLPSQSSWEE